MTSRWRCAVALVVALVAIAGCTPRSGEGKQTDTARQQALDQITRRLEAEPGVRSAKVWFTEDASTPATVSVDIEVDRARYPDLAPLLDVVEREVWRSRVEPLTVIAISALRLPRQSSDRGSSRRVLVDTERARLTEQYGERPGAG